MSRLRVALGLIFVSCTAFVFWGMAVKAERDLATSLGRGGFAPVPAEATEVRSAVTYSSASWSAYLTFVAPPEVIEDYIAASPGSEGGFRGLIGVDEPYVSCREIRDPDWWLQKCWMPSTAATWFTPTVMINGRLIDLPGGSTYARGTLIIDDEANRVWLHLTRP